jgi:hypothetical protein
MSENKEENGLIGEVFVPNYEMLWKDSVRERDSLVEETYRLERKLIDLQRNNAELMRKLLEYQNKRRRSFWTNILQAKIKVPLS